MPDSSRKFTSNPAIQEELLSNSNPKSSFLESEMSVVEEEKEEYLGATLELTGPAQPTHEPDIEEEFDGLESQASDFLRELYEL